MLQLPVGIQSILRDYDAESAPLVHRHRSKAQMQKTSSGTLSGITYRVAPA
jgi:hypothetical protein